MKLKNSKAAAFFENSAIMRFSKKCYDAMLSGFFGSMITSYSSLEGHFENGFFGGASDGSSWEKSVFSRMRRRIIVSYEKSGFIGAMQKAKDWLLAAPMRFYGFFFAYFGICVLLGNLIKRFAFTGYDTSFLGWIVGALFAFAAFPMLFSSKNLAGAIGDSLIFSTIVFDLLGFSSVALKRYYEMRDSSKRYFISALLGAVLGCLSFFISPALLAIGALGVVWCILVYCNPEIGVLTAVFVAPFLTFIGSPSIILALLVLFTFICMCIKAFFGKIIIKLELSDAFVGIFMLIMLAGGIISIGGTASFKESAIYVCFMLMYFMIVNLINTREWLGRISVALVSSGTLTALYGIYQKLSGNMEMGTMDKDVFGDIGGRVTSTFENSNMLGVFIIMVFPFALSYVFSSKKLYMKLASLVSCGILGVCLIYTWSRGAWLGLILACFVFVLLYGHYIIPILVPAGALGVTLFWNKIGGNGLFGNLISRFSSIVTMSDTSSVYRLGIWRGSLKVAEENWFTGIGVGPEAFRKVYIKFAESGIETAVHSHNLFLQIFIENGAVGFAVFIIALALCVGSGLELVRRSNSASAPEKAITVAAISGLFAALLQGMTDFIWFNYRIFFFFWVVAALISVSARIGMKKIKLKSDF